MKLVHLILLGALAAGSAMAADADGKWQCSIKGADGAMHPLVVTLKTDDTDLTGTINGPDGKADITISDGMNHGSMVMWSAKIPAKNGAEELNYMGYPAKDEMKIEVKRADGKGSPMTCTAKKVK